MPAAAASQSAPTTMTAIRIARPGGPEALTLATLPTPRPKDGEILVKVAAAGVNYPDVMQRKGGYPPPPGAPDTPGLEVAGTVVARGAEAGEWRIGDRVCALVAGGGYAEYCIVPAPQALPIPKGLDMVAAAAIPETFFTVWVNLFDRGNLKAGESVLVHGGSGGIGSAAIQVAHAFGARVFATARTAEKCAACEAIGAERAINYQEADFVEVVQDLTGGRGVDLIIDIVGGDYLARNFKALAVEGRLVQVAVRAGAKVEVPLYVLMQKRLTLTGSTLRPRPVAEKGRIAAALRRSVWPLFESGKIKPLIYKTFPLARAAEAHALMESSEHIGKIVLTV
jgi:putative PIG3 family NAD(P)H quinone oxidoreductase